MGNHIYIARYGHRPFTLPLLAQGILPLQAYSSFAEHRRGISESPT
jgi:hypothetical protein